MSTNHTPGPWAVGKPFMWHKREFLTVHYEGRVKPAIAHVIDQSEGAGLDAQDHANARLIAAAPELLAALEGLMSDSYDYGMPFNHPALQAARAAIAAATGEQT